MNNILGVIRFIFRIVIESEPSRRRRLVQLLWKKTFIGRTSLLLVDILLCGLFVFIYIGVMFRGTRSPPCIWLFLRSHVEAGEHGVCVHIRTR